MNAKPGTISNDEVTIIQISMDDNNPYFYQKLSNVAEQNKIIQITGKIKGVVMALNDSCMTGITILSNSSDIKI
jgi:hypothetical protein